MGVADAISDNLLVLVAIGALALLAAGAIVYLAPSPTVFAHAERISLNFVEDTYSFTVEVRVTNKADKTLFLKSIRGIVTTLDGTYEILLASPEGVDTDNLIILVPGVPSTNALPQYLAENKIMLQPGTTTSITITFKDIILDELWPITYWVTLVLALEFEDAAGEKILVTTNEVPVLSPPGGAAGGAGSEPPGWGEGPPGETR